MLLIVDFTVVIPLYNKARFIGRALDSVLRQRVSQHDIVVVDDGSTDEGPDLVMAYRDPRIRLIRQANQGAASARNRGIKAARGKYIAFLDGDDVWKPNYLELISSMIRRYPAAGAYATAYEIIRPDGRSVMPKFQAIPDPPWEGILPRYFRSCLAHQPVWTSATTVPKRIFWELGGFPAGIAVGEDLDMWGRIALKYPIAFSTAVGASYYQDDEQRHRIRETFFHGNPEAVFVRSANEAIRRGEVGSVDLQDLHEYMTKIQIDLANDCLVNDQNPDSARQILLKTRPHSRRFRWRKYRMLMQTYFPGFITRMLNQ